jgi:hypothetical protein
LHQASGRSFSSRTRVDGLLNRHRQFAWLAVAGLLTGCASESPLSQAGPEKRAPSNCEREAVQLIEATTAYAAPSSRAVPVATLGVGRFVYRCEQHREWSGVMFPAIDEKVDCTRRAAEGQCQSGWVRGVPRVRQFD